MLTRSRKRTITGPVNPRPVGCCFGQFGYFSVVLCRFRSRLVPICEREHIETDLTAMLRQVAALSFLGALGHRRQWRGVHRQRRLQRAEDVNDPVALFRRVSPLCTRRDMARPLERSEAAGGFCRKVGIWADFPVLDPSKIRKLGCTRTPEFRLCDRTPSHRRTP